LYRSSHRPAAFRHRQRLPGAITGLSQRLFAGHPGPVGFLPLVMPTGDPSAPLLAGQSNSCLWGCILCGDRAVLGDACPWPDLRSPGLCRVWPGSGTSGGLGYRSVAAYHSILGNGTDARYIRSLQVPLPPRLPTCALDSPKVPLTRRLGPRILDLVCLNQC
jgi:hypothetical protein